MGEQGSISIMSYKSCYLSNNYNTNMNNSSSNYNIMMRADSASSSNFMDIMELEGIMNSEINQLEQSNQCPVLTVVRNINDIDINFNDINSINDINYSSGATTTPAIISCLNDATLDELLASAMLNDYASNNDVINNGNNNYTNTNCISTPAHLRLSTSDGYGELQYSPASNMSSCSCTINSNDNINHSSMCSPISSTTNFNEAEAQEAGANTMNELQEASRSFKNHLVDSRSMNASKTMEYATLSEAKPQNLEASAKYDVLQPNLACTKKPNSSMLYFNSTSNINGGVNLTNIAQYTQSPSPSPSTQSQPPSLVPTSSSSSKEQMYRIAAMRPLHEDGIDVIDEGCSVLIVNNGMNLHKPIKRKNVRISSDPQSVAARQRRERISERIRTLQRLVPGTTKMDTASMLDEAIQYLKYLQKEVKCAKLRIRSANGILNSSSSSISTSLYNNKAYINHHQFAPSCFPTRVLQH